MICKEVVERLSEYWSNELDEATRNEITAHLQSCPICRQEWALMQSAMNALRNAPVLEPSPELLFRIKSAVRAKQMRRPVLIWRWQWVMAASAAVIVLVALSFPLLQMAKEKARSTKPFIAEMSTPALPSPSLKLSPQPIPSEPSAPLALSPSPSPAERIAKPKKATVRRGKERQPRGKLLEEMQIASEREEMPPLQIPTGERTFEGQPKDTPTEIAPPIEHSAPQIAQLPAEPRSVQFRAELELGRQGRASGAGNIEPALGLQGPTGQQGVTGQPSPALSAPMAGVRKGVGAETKPLAVVEEQFALRQQFGGGLAQAPLASPVNLRWMRFEPVVVGKVKLWELALRAETPQIVTVSVQPSEKVEILNAQKPAGEERLVVLHNVLPAGREISLPLLVKAAELGARRLLVTVETADRKTFSWWCIFPAMERESFPQLRRSIPIQVEQWTVTDLLAHLAWEGKIAFLLPEHFANRTVTLPTGMTPIANILASLERQLGGRWVRIGSTFNFSSPSSTLVVPMLKQ